MRKTLRLLTLLLRYYRENKELKKKVEILEVKALIDPLTGVYNRWFVTKELELRLSAQARHGTPLTVAFIDLDNFKSINDTYGHSVGDETLQKVATFIKSSIRGYDVFGRMGGEEFILLLPDAALKDAYDKLDDIRAAVAAERFVTAAPDRSVTLSIGLVECRKGDTQTGVYKLADKALYTAKHMGRDRVCIYERDA